ncbi:hypothetical protein [Serratia fonticola]|uniref:Uncharacterized protein n=1 Tax=Serratia fonticola TaxID=47917 RepID=A0AAW3WTH6_SERFO|nr:hypothetical protein [Serratia fonticola]MBC3213772.1 hypothetical protein [Serratia fonticola]NYA14723.1 hypothetical protein [Serratia fonticola]NYA34651.1 hypothetical protein [Serratia fonticola]
MNNDINIRREFGYYAELHDTLMSMKKNELIISDQDMFVQRLRKSGMNSFPDMPLIKYEKGMRVPKGCAQEVLSSISEMLKKDIELPKEAKFYLYEAIDAYLDGKYGLEEALFLKLNYEKESKEKTEFKNVIDGYLHVRIAIMYHMDYKWSDLVSFRNESGFSFFDELSDELCYIHKLGIYNSKNESLVVHGVSLSPEKIKNRIISKKINEILLWTGRAYMEDQQGHLRDYNSYLNYKKTKAANKIIDASKRYDELRLLEKYWSVQHELSDFETFDSWLETLRGSI